MGVPLVTELVRRNHDVKLLARNNVPPNSFPEQAEIVYGALEDENALRKAADGAEWIFHLAAKLHISNPDARLSSEYQKINVEATAKLLDLAQQNNAEKFVFFSTINVYGASENGDVFDETSRLNPHGFYAESKAAAEKLVLQKDFGVVLRLAAVYGSRMKGNYVRLLNALKKGRFFFIGQGSNRRTLVHQLDAANAAILAAENAFGSSIYNVTDGEIHSLKEIIEAMSRALGKDTPKISLPLAPIRFGIGLSEKIGKLTRIKTPVNRILLEKFLEDTAVSGLKIQRELGFVPQFDLKKGWQQAVEG